MAMGISACDAAENIRAVRFQRQPAGRGRRQNFCVPARSRVSPSAVMQHPDFFHGHESAAHHPVQRRQEGVDLFLAVHDFDDERQIHREPQDFRRVQAAGLAKAQRRKTDEDSVSS